jgi:hypothetical protein
MDTVNIGCRASAFPPFILHCLRGGPLPQKWQVPLIRVRGGAPSMSGITFPNVGDLIPYTRNTWKDSKSVSQLIPRRF